MTSKKRLRLPIRPVELYGKPVKIRTIRSADLSNFKSLTKRSIHKGKAVVAFLDILGFSEKSDTEEIDQCFTDFPNPMIFAAKQFPRVRFNFFSDNIILAADLGDAGDLISAVRSAFKRWVWNGILVRGGLALGTYDETDSAILRMAPPNFRGYFISGTGIAKAVRNEARKPAALLFTDAECARYLKSKFREPIFKYRDETVIAWSDEIATLQWLLGISLVRLLRLLSLNDAKYSDVIGKFHNTIAHCLDLDINYVLYCKMLAILSSDFVDPTTREVAFKIFKISPSVLAMLKPAIDVALRDRNGLSMLWGMATTDSSMPFYLKWSKS